MNVATKADVQAEIASLRSEMHGGFARTDVAIERLRLRGWMCSAGVEVLLP